MEIVTVDAARYVPSSSSNNKRATAVPSAPRHRTTAAAAATAFRVGDGGCGRRRASAATVVGCGTSTAASARRWRVLGRIVRIVSAARRAQGTQRIVRTDCRVEMGSFSYECERVTLPQRALCPGFSPCRAF